MRKIILALLTVLATVVVWPAQAEAASVRTVYVVSQLPYPRYRVDYSVLDWNKAPYVNMYMAKSCTGHAHCVVIKEAELGTTLAGVTTNQKRYDSSGRWVGTYSVIKIDYAMRSKTYYGRKWVVCHELGHTVFVGHTKHYCMNDGQTVAGYPSWTAIPGSYNLSLAR